MVPCFRLPFGEVGGRKEVGGRSVSSWWRDLGRILEGDGESGGGWFDHSVIRKVGDGAETFFWSHRWIGGILLSVRFRRLFDLAENKTITVANFFSLGLARQGEGWRWRRRLWAWEEDMLEECRALLFDVLLVPNVSDKWVWLLDIADEYYVRVAYDLLLNCDNSMLDTSLELVWHKQVPLKVIVFTCYLAHMGPITWLFVVLFMRTTLCVFQGAVT